MYKNVFKETRSQSKLHIGRTFEDIKKLGTREAYMYLCTEGSHAIERKIEKEKLKKELFRRLSLVLCTE